MRVNLSPKDIFEQEFKTSLRGYDKKEVDNFLDDVIKDYESFQKEIQTLKAENTKLKEQLAKSTKEAALSSLASSEVVQTSPVSAAPTGVSNFDLLRRISRLEREVFGKQISE